MLPCLQAILEELGAEGLSVHVADYSAWGPSLSALLRRAKIVLNLHHNEAGILEMCRIMESLSYGALVHLCTQLICDALQCRNSVNRQQCGALEVCKLRNAPAGRKFWNP